MVSNNPASFLIQVFRGGKWEALDTQPDSSLNHLTLFVLFARDGATPDASAVASDNTLLFPKHLPETEERPFGSEGRGLAVAGVAILALVAGAWLVRRR